MKYESKDGIKFEVFMIESIEERDHHTMALMISCPARSDKHVISRDAYKSHAPRARDYIAFYADGSIKVIPKGQLAVFGAPDVDKPSLAAPDGTTVAISKTEDPTPVVLPVAPAESNNPIDLTKIPSNIISDDRSSVEPTTEAPASKPVMSLSRLAPRISPAEINAPDQTPFVDDDQLE